MFPKSRSANNGTFKAPPQEQLDVMRFISNRVGQGVFDKYRRCVICGSSVALQIAHILPLSLGGSNSSDNLILLCPTCHVAIDRTGIGPDLLTRIRERWSFDPSPGLGLVIESLASRNATDNEEGGEYLQILANIPTFDEQVSRILGDLAKISDERVFLRRYVKPLVDSLGFLGSTILHMTGRPEHGKDMVFYALDGLEGVTFYAVVACIGKIHADSSKTSDSGHYAKIQDQICKAKSVAYADPNLKCEQFIDKIVVACSDRITLEAESQLLAWEKRNGTRLIFLPADRLAGHWYKIVR
jgi:hypothetical protein